MFDKYVNQYGDRDTCVVFTHLNPILQNNYNETLTVLRNANFASRLPAKKRKPTSFSKSQILSAENTSSEKACFFLHSQIQKPAGQRMPGSFTNRPIVKEAVKEKYVSQPIHKDNKYKFVVCGVNLKGDICHEIMTTGRISGTRSQVLNSLEKSIIPIEEVPKKRMVVVDYIPISKPVKMHSYSSELCYQDSSLSVKNFSAINYCTEGKAIRKDRRDMNQDVSGKKAFLGKTSQESTEFSGYCHPFSFEDNSEIPSTISTLSSKGFQKEVNVNFKSQELPPFQVIIPTAQCDASESMQKATDH